MGNELLRLVNKKVELKGTGAEKEGAKTITIIEYKAIEQPYSPSIGGGSFPL